MAHPTGRNVELPADARQLRVILERLLAKPREVRSLDARSLELLNSRVGADEWLREAGRYINACGCKESAVAALIAAPLGAAIAYAQASDRMLNAALHIAGGCFAAFVLGAIIGKAYGLLQARYRFRSKTRRWLESLTS